MKRQNCKICGRLMGNLGLISQVRILAHGGGERQQICKYEIYTYETNTWEHLTAKEYRDREEREKEEARKYLNKIKDRKKD